MPSNRGIQTSAADFGSYGDASNGTDYLIVNNTWRIKQHGILNKVKFWSSKDITAEFRIKVWRYDAVDGYYDLVGQSEDISGSIGRGTNTITLSSTITVQEGDYLGFKMYEDSDVFDAYGDSLTYYISNLTATTAVNFKGASSRTQIVPIEAYLTESPAFVAAGASLTAGHQIHYSFVEGTSGSEDLDGTIAYNLRKLISDNQGVTYNYWNIGCGGMIMSGIYSTMRLYVYYPYFNIYLNPRFAVIESSINDVARSSTQAAFLAGWGNILTLCRTEGIRPIIWHMTPWTAGSNAQMQTRDAWKTALESYVNTNYSDLDALIVDVDSYVGQYRSGGADGNLWNIKTEYRSGVDGVHFNAAGYAKIAEAIYEAMVGWH